MARSLSLCLAVAQPPTADSSGHRGEPFHVHPHLCPEDEQPAAVGPQQQLSDRPATGHGQVTFDLFAAEALAVSH